MNIYRMIKGRVPNIFPQI